MPAEQVMRPTEARTHGAGLLLAESLIGINHRLHSRAAAVVPLMLQEDVLTPADLKVGFRASTVVDLQSLDLYCKLLAVQHHQEHLLAKEQGQQVCLYIQGTKAQHMWTLDMLRDRAAEVNRVALDRLLQHTRRGSLHVLWDAALAEVEARLAHYEDAPPGTHIPKDMLNWP